MIKCGQQPVIKRQRGAAAVEFGIIAIVFFTLLLGIIEFGRLLYLWNTVQEVTRSAARQAVVTDFTDASAIENIKRTAIFRGGSTGTVQLPAGGEISNLQVSIRYLNADFDEIRSGNLPVSPADNIEACFDALDNCIRYVEASVCQQRGNDCDPVQYAPWIGWFTFLTIDIPSSTVVMPAESLGYRPD